MKALTEHQIQALKRFKRIQRTAATLCENGMIGTRVMRDTAKNPQERAVYDVMLRMTPHIVSESRSLADEAERMLRCGASTEEQWLRLESRTNRNTEKLLAMNAEMPR